MNASQPRKFFRMQIDYDLPNRDEVEADAKKLAEAFPELGGVYRIEQSKRFYHVVYPLSMLPSFDDCVRIAEQSKCDRDWLDLSKTYGCFAVVTEQGKTLAKSLRLKAFPPRPIKKPALDIKQPVVLILHPETPTDMGRLRAICESMVDDKEWEWRIEATLQDYGGRRIRIGCRDEYQSKRRAAWLEKQGLKFKWEIIKQKE
jgi:hypothetical protein